ncbi:unnamed protein product [Cunninghamella blakesleeana]
MPAMPDVDFLEKYQSNSETSNVESHPNGKRRLLNSSEDTIDDDFQPEADDQFIWNDNDEEGRFFGGGLTDEQSKLLDLVEQFEDDEESGINSTSVKRMILKFEKAINKNQELRMRYADDPTKFMESEADLDEEIKNLLVLTQAPHLYGELVKLNSVSSLVSLLSHENTDISIDAIDLISELLDEDVGIIVAGEEEGGNDIEKRSEEAEKGIKTFMDSLLKHELLSLLVQNLERLDESEETDRQGIFKILGIFENLLSLDPKLAKNIALNTKLTPWLLKRIQHKDFDSNRGYASEIISILLQEDHDVHIRFCELGAVDIILRVLSSYKRKDPDEEDEAEMVENLFNSLVSLLNETKGRSLFFEGEGIELMLIMLKEKTTLARIKAVKVLNYAMTGEIGRDSCVRFVDCSGLKSLFPLFMAKGTKKLKKAHKSFVEQEDEEHILCVILSLLRYLSSNDVQRLRVIHKFIEDDYEKVDRLIEIKQFYQEKDQAVQQLIEEDIKKMNPEDIDELMEEEFNIRRLNNGLYILQRVCLILAVLCAENEGIAAKADLLLGRQNLDKSSIMNVIEEETAVLADFVNLRKIAMGVSTATDKRSI